MLKLMAVSLGLLLLSGQAVAESETTNVPILSFEFLGCGGVLGADNDYATAVKVLTADKGTTYLARHPAGCGLEGRNPQARMSNGELHLQYELYSPSHAIVMCECEYWAKFRVDASRVSIDEVALDVVVSRPALDRQLQDQ